MWFEDKSSSSNDGIDGKRAIKRIRASSSNRLFDITSCSKYS